MHNVNRNGSSTITQDKEDPFRYGYRFVKKRLANGDVIEVREPLTLQDVFFPQEGDELVATANHNLLIAFLIHALGVAMAEFASFSMTFDTNTDFDVEDAPDVRSDLLAVLEAHTFDKHKGTIVVSETGAKTVLAVEVTSPTTRKNDLEDKVEYYRKGKVDIYLIIDYGATGKEPPVLIGRRRVKGKWKMMKPDSQGRLDLQPFNVLIGTDNDEIRMYRRDNGELIPPGKVMNQQRIAAEEEAKVAKEQVKEADKRADKAEKKADKAKKVIQAKDQELAELRALLQQHGIQPPTK